MPCGEGTHVPLLLHTYVPSSYYHSADVYFLRREGGGRDVSSVVRMTPRPWGGGFGDFVFSCLDDFPRWADGRTEQGGDGRGRGVPARAGPAATGGGQRRADGDGFGGRDEQGGRFGRTVCETDPGAAGPAHSPLLIDAVCPLMPISRDEALYERHQGQTVQPMARTHSLSARVIITIPDPSS
ncbi:hypothetical protein PCL_12552 [Purpureocillium lilacinum]|uniref:Uncharacterized protein n=1 Tax=Purpureocillium lilacinum TaxID=33203 RepID=A0A2U3E9K1_PURLI|nr:hypothetical protein PCL_12552 [Purpureocillium lilacinum]